MPRLVRLLKRLGMRQAVLHARLVHPEKYPAPLTFCSTAVTSSRCMATFTSARTSKPRKTNSTGCNAAISSFEAPHLRAPARRRAPSFAFSKHSLGYLVAEGFTYDASLMGDDMPYLLRHRTGSLIEAADRLDAR